MNKIKNLLVIILFSLPVFFVSNAQELDNDCDEVVAQLKAAKSQYEADYKQQKKSYENWSKYNEELHSNSYGLTDEPLAESYKKCKSGEIDKKDFCKGVTEKYDEISGKEAPAKAEYGAAEATAYKSRHEYNVLVTQARELGCNPKKK